MKNEYENQAVAPEEAPLEKDKPFWVIVDEDRDIVNVRHPDFGEIKAVFSEEYMARNALAMSRNADPAHMAWQVLPAIITDPEDE